MRPAYQAEYGRGSVPCGQAPQRGHRLKVQTRIGRGRRIWVCPVCGWRATISTRKHFQTGQPLTREQQIGSLAVDAQRHFRTNHLSAFLR